MHRLMQMTARDFPWPTALALTAFTFVLAGAASAQTAANVLVVINVDSPESVSIGEYYAVKRAISADHIVRIRCATVEAVVRNEYERTIEAPIGAWLTRYGLQDQILYIVLTKGVPLRIAGTGGRDGTVSSVDSELTLLYRELLDEPPPLVGHVPNPYFLDEREIADALPFSRATSDTYLVTRLDGFTIEDVKALIDRGMAPAANGTIVLDQKVTAIDRGGDAWLEQTADRLKGGAVPAVLETTQALARVNGSVLGYYSWGSNDPANQLRRFGLSFAPGAIGGLFVSTDGRTFIEPPDTWRPSNPNGGPIYRGSFQSLAADLVRDGITGVSAHVDEPYLDGIVHPQVLFPAYVAGFNLAESFYLAMPYLSWQNIVIGDPLCRPFSRPSMPAAPSSAIDPDTELPTWFSQRRLARASQGGLKPEAVKLLLKKDAQVARGETANAEALLIRATELEPRLVAAHAQLAMFYESTSDYPKAIERYRRVVALDPEDALALNNLAYALAVRQSAAREALPLAERAYRLSRQMPEMADTVGWIQHLLGEDRTAAFYIEQALRGAPNNPDILLHAATVHALLKDMARARAELAAAERLGPPVTDRDDFKALQAQLKRP